MREADGERRRVIRCERLLPSDGRNEGDLKMGDTEWRQSPDGEWWFRGPDGSWHPSNTAPEATEPQAPHLTTPAADPESAARRARPTAGTAALPKAPPLPPTETIRSANPATLATGAWLAIAAGVLAVISSFLPWEHLSAVFVSVDRNGFQLGQNESFSPDGLIVLLLGMVTAIIGITRLTRTPAPSFLQRSPILTGIAIIVVGALEISPINQQIQTIENASSAAAGSIGFGLWLAIISGVTAVVAGLVIRSNSS